MTVQRLGLEAVGTPHPVARGLHVILSLHGGHVVGGAGVCALDTGLVGRSVTLRLFALGVELGNQLAELCQ